MTVIGFKSKEDKIKDSIISKLEAYLALAKKGEITTFVVASVLDDGSIQSTCTGDRLQALGALRVAESNILDTFETEKP